MFQHEITFDRFIRWVIIAAIVIAAFLTLNYLSKVLLPFFIAWALAYLTFPVVTFIERRLHIRVRAISIIIMMVLLIAVITGVVLLIIPPMIEQFQKLGVIATKYLHDVTNISSFPEAVGQWVRENNNDIEKFFRSKDFTDMVKVSAPQLFNVVGKTATVVKSAITSCIILMYMFFILLDYEYLTTNWIKIFPKDVRPFWQSLGHDVAIAMNNYVRGQGTIALIMGILFCIGFTIIGFPMAIGLGILIGILDLVPYLHAFALIPTAFLAALKAADTGQNFWIIFASAVAVFAIVQVIIDMIVTPKIMGKAMGLNPAVLLLSLSVWGALLGFIGLIIALPLTTIIIAYWERYVTGDIPLKNYESDQEYNQATREGIIED